LSFIPSLLDRSVVDSGFKVKDVDAIGRVHELSAREGILIGGTGGVVVHALLALAADFGRGDNLIGVIPDGGDRYQDTLFNPRWLTSHGLTPQSTAPASASFSELRREIRKLGCEIGHLPPPAGPSFVELCHQFGLDRLIRSARTL
jgi:hypothetical protein